MVILSEMIMSYCSQSYHESNCIIHFICMMMSQCRWYHWLLPDACAIYDFYINSIVQLYPAISLYFTSLSKQKFQKLWEIQCVACFFCCRESLHLILNTSPVKFWRMMGTCNRAAQKPLPLLPCFVPSTHLQNFALAPDWQMQIPLRTRRRACEQQRWLLSSSWWLSGHFLPLSTWPCPRFKSLWIFASVFPS